MVQAKNGGWRIKINEELGQELGDTNVTRFIKTQKLRWLCHIKRIKSNKIAKSVTVW